MTAGQRGTRPVRLYCFAHAGAGTSSFEGWAGRAGPDVEVVPLPLPGRGGRAKEPAITGREALLADLMGHFTAAAPPEPFALYGHSLGAMVAYTVTRALHEAGLPGPVLLAVGACPPPTVPSPLSDAWAAPEAELVGLLTEMGAVPDRAAPGGFWYRTVLPVLRDDLALGHRLRVAAREPAPGGLPDVPLLAVSGDRDRLGRPGDMAGWREWTTGPVTLHTVPGDHYFAGGPDLPVLLGRACRTAADRAPDCCSGLAQVGAAKVGMTADTSEGTGRQWARSHLRAGRHLQGEA
ncbi:thioesterase domain-containing protein [Streptomyces flaveolus]|uniref:thioesterase II family protein n=1 Tax=Streptomyces flaveolus TaxID=67297 RepID=UPI0034458D9D